MKEKLAKYELEDKYVWDFWYIKADGIYHAFYLQYNKNADKQYIHERCSVGHATSVDLVSWKEEQLALEADPSTWNDLGIATGSVICRNSKYFMLYTGKSTYNVGGIGLAESSDLLRWSRCGDKPVIPDSAFFSASWKGRELLCHPLADPYIYPEAIDGWYYLVINSQVVDEQEGKRGCQLMLKSRDLVQWESHNIAAYPECFERMETAQIWEHDGHWYMLFGGVPDMKTYIYMANTFDGPYEPQEWSKLELPDGCEGFYLAKVETDTKGDSVLLANDCLIDKKRLLGIYKMCYCRNGKISLFD